MHGAPCGRRELPNKMQEDLRTGATDCHKIQQNNLHIAELLVV